MNGNRTEAQSVVRACNLLRAFRHKGEVLSLAELATRTSLSKTTVFRLMRSLVRGGLAECVGKGSYRSLVLLQGARTIRLGFAAQTDSEFSREVTRGMELAAARAGVHLTTVNNRYSARRALENAELLIREGVDLVIEFQTYERVAPVIASKFLEARIPVIALEVPHPGATYFGANNYQAGLIGGRALGRWAKTHWNGEVEEILLLELPIAGSLPQLRISGFLAGLRQELPNLDRVPVTHLDGKGDLERNLWTVRKHLTRYGARRRTLIGAINDMAALGALRAFEEAGALHLCAAMGQNGTRQARLELRRRGSRLIGTVAYFPERYGDEVIPLALGILQHKLLPSAVFVKHQLLTADNVDHFYPLDTKESAA